MIKREVTWLHDDMREERFIVNTDEEAISKADFGRKLPSVQSAYWSLVPEQELRERELLALFTQMDEETQKFVLDLIRAKVEGTL